MYKIIGADNKEYGPVPLETIKQWIIEGRANAKTLVMVEGEQYWRQLSTVPELAALLPVQYQSISPSTPPYPQSVSGQKQNGMAIASFVCGILSILTCCCFGGFPLNVLAIVFGVIALYQIKSDPSQKGKGLAIAGIVLGAFAIVIMSLLWFSVLTSKEFRDLMLEYQRRWKV